MSRNKKNKAGKESSNKKVNKLSKKENKLSKKENKLAKKIEEKLADKIMHNLSNVKLCNKNFMRQFNQSQRYLNKLKYKHSFQFFAITKHNLDIICSSVTDALNVLKEQFQKETISEDDNPQEEELCSPSNSNLNLHPTPSPVGCKSQGFKSYFNEEQDRKEEFDEDISEPSTDPELIQEMDETIMESDEKTVNCSFNSYSENTETPSELHLETNDSSIQNESLQKENYKPGPILPVGGTSALFQGILYKVKLSNLDPNVKYDDVSTILLDIGINNNSVEDIMLVNHAEKTFVVISFNNIETMKKALSFSKKINHKGRIITIKPVSKRLG